MHRQIKAGQLLRLVTVHDDGEDITLAVVKAKIGFDMTMVARQFFHDEVGEVKDDAEPQAFSGWLVSNGYVKVLPVEEVQVGYYDGPAESLLCFHENQRTYVQHGSGAGNFGNMVTTCDNCHEQFDSRPATEEEYLVQFPYMRSAVTGRRMTDEEYGIMLRELAEKREQAAAEAAKELERQRQAEAEEIMSKLDLPAFLAVAGIIPHSGCTAVADDIEAQDPAAPVEAEVTVSTIMHNGPKFRLRCKKCGRQFIIA